MQKLRQSKKKVCGLAEIWTWVLLIANLQVYPLSHWGKLICKWKLLDIKLDCKLQWNWRSLIGDFCTKWIHLIHHRRAKWIILIHVRQTTHQSVVSTWIKSIHFVHACLIYDEILEYKAWQQTFNFIISNTNFGEDTKRGPRNI